jgi:acetyltransferase-like isoleucine patch superfamily enzyme
MNVGRKTNIAKTGLNISAKVAFGDFCSVAPYVTFTSRTQHACIAHPQLVATHQFPDYPKAYSEDHIVIGNDVWIGMHAVILGGVTVGHGAIIGAYTVVAKDVPPYAVVVGNPATVKRYRFTPEQIAGLLELRWWNWDDATLAARMADFHDVDVLLSKYSDYHPEIEKHVRFVTD